MTEEKKKVGRPTQLGTTKPLQIHFTAEQREWLMNQEGSAAETVRALVDEAMRQASKLKN